MNENHLKEIIAHCKSYGFIFQSSEIYDGLSAVYDYAQNGVELKNNLKRFWWESMVQKNINIVGIDSAIFMHPSVWEASGHVNAFNDPLIDNKTSKKRYRADVLVEDYIEKQKLSIQKQIEKAKKRFSDFNENLFISTNPKIKKLQEKISEVHKRLEKVLNQNDLIGLKALIDDLAISCSISGTKDWTAIKQFNLMFDTKVGASATNNQKIYLRPETAQGIFINYLNVQKSGRMKIPFGIAQIGKAFRNEIIARQFIFRMREFEQMEMQFFVPPGEHMTFYENWKEKRKLWLEKILPKKELRFHNHIKLAHYADAACDIEFNFPMGFKELEGIHSRTDFDLKEHEKFTGKKLTYFNSELDKHYTPYVIETSIGLDRLFLAVISTALKTETLEDNSTRTLLKLPYFLAPYKIAVLPLVKKDGLAEFAKNKVLKTIQDNFMCTYDEKDSIGKRYRRQDALGTPFCLTIDHNGLKDSTVTLRDRDTMKQERIKITEISTIIFEKINLWMP